MQFNPNARNPERPVAEHVDARSNDSAPKIRKDRDAR